MVLCFFGVLPIFKFSVEMYVFVFILMLTVNCNQLFVYCKLSGSPYKNNKSYENVRHLGVVCGVWSFGFLVKLISFNLGSALYDVE